METFRMIDIISLLGLPYPSGGQSSYYVQCPCCDDSAHERHLNINLKKEVFRCPKCGISGGMFDLYSLYTGVPRDKVGKAIAKKLKPDRNMNIPRVHIESRTETVECPLADIEIRHSVYSTLLNKLSLANDHVENLMNRGLTETAIERLGYKTTPVLGMTAIAK